jgi:hypothetical protein
VPRILETIVSTLDPQGAPNFAPMGITLDAGRVVLRPFRGTATWSNLQTTPSGVVHATDDALLFARAALSDEVPPHRPASAVRGVVLRDACHVREFVVEESDLAAERAVFRARVVAEGRGREFAGFNRASHAVIEATILATRLHLLGVARVTEEMERLRPLVDKTGGPGEHEAFAFVAAHVRGWTP